MPPQVHNIAPQRGLQVRHQQRGGNPFPADITQCQSEFVHTEGQKIVIVAADGSSRQAYSGQLHARHFGSFVWEKPFLHLLGDFEFTLEPFLLNPFFYKVLHIFRHLIEGCGKRAQLIFRPHDNPMTEIAPFHKLGPAIQAVDGVCDGLGQQYPNENRCNLHDQEENNN